MARSEQQRNRFLLAQARAIANQRAKRERTRPVTLEGKSTVQESTEQAAKANAAAVAAESTPPSADDTFDPTNYTVAEVLDHVEQNPDAIKAVLKAEKAGKGRAGILALEG